MMAGNQKVPQLEECIKTFGPKWSGLQIRYGMMILKHRSGEKPLDNTKAPKWLLVVTFIRTWLPFILLAIGIILVRLLLSRLGQGSTFGGM